MTKANEIKFKSTIVFQQTWEAVKSQNYKLIEQVGGSRSSKTWSNFQVLFLYMFSNPMITATILRDTQKSCREIVETDWIKWLSDPMGRKKELEDGVITYQEFADYIQNENLTKHFIRNKTNHTWTMIHNNSFVRFTGLDDPDDAMGMTQDISWINEPYSFAHEIYRQLSQRTSKFILFDWNPKQNHWIETERQKDNSITLKSTLLDNPFCPKESRVQILSYQPVKYSNVVVSKLITEEEVNKYNLDLNPLEFTKKQLIELKRCIYNEYTNSASEYHWLVYGLGEKAEKPNRIFKWKIVSQNEYENLKEKKYIGVDWGKVDPWGIVECKYYDGKLYVKELNYLSENQWREKMNSTDRLAIDADTSEEGIEGGIVLWLFKKLGIKKKYDLICDSNRLTKIAVLRRNGYENALPAKTKETGKSGIMDGIELLSLLDVCIVEGSTNLIAENENYSFKVDRYGATLEEPEDQNNHLHDPIRYVAQYLRKIGVIRKI
jgi:phage terminase large subunit